MSSAAPAAPSAPGPLDRARVLAPGVAFCAAIGVAAWALARAEVALVGYALIEAVVVSPMRVLAGTVLGRGVERGIDAAFSQGGALLVRTAAVVGARLQDGDVGKYAWLVAAGALALVAALLLS